MSKVIVGQLNKITFNAQIPKRGGGFYEGTIINYTVPGQAPYDKGIPKQQLDQNPMLLQQLAALQGSVGQFIQLNTVPNTTPTGQTFHNIVSAALATPEQVQQAQAEASSKKSFSGGRKSPEMTLDELKRISKGHALQAAASQFKTVEETIEAAKRYATFLLEHVEVTTPAVTTMPTTATVIAEPVPNPVPAQQTTNVEF